MNAPLKTPTQLDLVGAPTQKQLRKLLVAGVEDFDAKQPQKTAEELVDVVLASRGPTAVIQANDDFDWYESPHVVLRHQTATALYENAAGGITIRQEREWNEDNDPIMSISSENAFTFAEAFAKLVKRS